MAYYEKCMDCKLPEFDKAINECKARNKYLEGYLIVFIALSIITIVLTAFRQEVFWNDTKEFFVGLITWMIKIAEIAYILASELAGFITKDVSAGMWHDIAYWGIVIIQFALVSVLFVLIVNLWWEKVKEGIVRGISTWSVSVIVLLLMVLLYLSDYIEGIIPINLFLTWIIGAGVIIAGASYIAVCRKNRGWSI